MEVKPRVLYRVDIIEFDFGQHILDSKCFDNESEASKYIKDFNARGYRTIIAEGPYQMTG